MTSAWPWPPPWPAAAPRPGTVLGSAVLAFIQAGLVLLTAFLAVYFGGFILVASEPRGGPESSDGVGSFAAALLLFVVLHGASAGVLIAAGVMALGRRRPLVFPAQVIAWSAQLLLVLAWILLLQRGTGGSQAFVSVVYALAPVVGLGLTLSRSGRRWLRVPRSPV